MQFRFDALIVDKDLSSRMQLRQATAAIPEFSQISMANSISSAIETLQTDQNCDIILFKPNFSDNENADFIKRCKETRNGVGCALILVLKSDLRNAGNIATNFAKGVDAFLPEPYSVDNLNEIFKLAGEMKKKKFEHRCRTAIEIVLKDAPTALDNAALEHKCGVGGSKRKEWLKLAVSLQDLAVRDFASYEELLIRRFETVSPPAIIGSPYSGVSERLRKKMAKEAEQSKKAELAKKTTGPRVYRRG